MQWTDESIAFLRDAAAINRYYETIAERIAPRCIVPMHYRGEDFGFDELGTLDTFTALFAAEEVHFLESDTFTLTAAEPRGVIVPQLENAEKTDGV